MNNNNFLDNFRKVDYFPLKLITKTYTEISDYLLNKFGKTIYNNISSNINNEYNDTIKTVKVFYRSAHVRWYEFTKKELKGKINIKLDKENPDYLIYGPFSCGYYDEKYKNAIKIAFFTENQIPDLNYADYAIGFSHINYLDRFFSYPFFIHHMYTMKLYIENITKAREDALKYNNRTKFCGAVISNGQGMRVWFIHQLNKYKIVDMGGRYHNNIGGRVKNKIKFLSQYKFSIGMENSEGDGYFTEKLIDSFLAGTIPIYFGDYTADEFINPKSFILIRDKHDILEKIEYIKKIDNDDELYKSILREKIFTEDNFLEKMANSRKNFLFNIFQQKKELAKRTDNYHFNISN